MKIKKYLVLTIIGIILTINCFTSYTVYAEDGGQSTSFESDRVSIDYQPKSKGVLEWCGRQSVLGDYIQIAYKNFIIYLDNLTRLQERLAEAIVNNGNTGISLVNPTMENLTNTIKSTYAGDITYDDLSIGTYAYYVDPTDQKLKGIVGSGKGLSKKVNSAEAQTKEIINKVATETFSIPGDDPKHIETIKTDSDEKAPKYEIVFCFTKNETENYTINDLNKIEINRID